MPVPSAPTGFTAIPTTYGILLTWDAQAGLDGFYLSRGLLANHTDEVIYPVAGNFVTDGSGTRYMDVGATAGTHYYYRLQASSNIDGDSTPVAADAVALSGMTLTTARAWVRQWARNAGNSTMYSDADIDRALITVCEQFCRVTKCVQVAGTVSLAAADSSFDVSGLTLFRPERILRANVLTVAKELEQIDWEEMYDLQIDTVETGKPTKLAFETSMATSGQVWPTPDIAYSLRLRWWQSFTSFTPGTASDASITFNLPDDYLTQILRYGVPAVLQGNEPEHKYAAEAWEHYMAFERLMMGAGNRGTRAIHRASVRSVG